LLILVDSIFLESLVTEIALEMEYKSNLEYLCGWMRLLLLLEAVGFCVAQALDT
jgi:hypothetical protein